MNPTLLQQASFIYNSNRIEGLGGTLSMTHELLKDWLHEKDEYAKQQLEKHFAVEINHYKAFDYILTEFAVRMPIWMGVLVIHGILMRGQLPPQDCGQLRSVQVYIGQYVPPAPGVELIGAVEKYMHFLKTLYTSKLKGKKLYKKIYESHCRFESLHPFRDGNGRAGRLFWIAQLKYFGFEFNEINFYDRPYYYQSLSVRGSWTPPRPFKQG